MGSSFSASSSPEAALVRRRMSYAEFEALPGDVRAEYVDGVALMSPPGTWDHQTVAFEVAHAVKLALPNLVTVVEAGVATGPMRRRIPDVAVVEAVPDAMWAEVPLLIAVEVLSPSTRSEDTLRKSTEYQQAGVGQYWIVDREHRSITVLVNNGSGWDIRLELTDDQPTGAVAVGEHGEVPLDLHAILRRDS